MVYASKLLYGVASIAIFSVPAMAEETPDPQRGAAATSKSAGTAGPLELKEIVVTAQRREESSATVPIAITAFGAEQLAQRSITTERDLQASVPGLVVKTVSSESQLTYSIRAQSVEPYSGVSPAVLAYVNDVEANTGAPGSFYDLSSVQVLKGPQGTLFGRNTTGGAILYTTTMPGKTLGGYVTQRVGNLGMLESLGAIDLPFSDAVRLRIAADYYTRDGYQENVYTGQTLGGSTRKSGRMTLVINPTDRIENKTIAEYSKSQGHPTMAVPYSVYQCGAPGLNTSGPCLYSPVLDTIFGFPGAWDIYLAAHPGAYPGGIPDSVGYQTSVLGPRRVNSPQSSNAGAEAWYAHNITEFEISDSLTIKNILGYSKSTSFFAVDQTGSPFSIEPEVPSPASGLPAGNHFGQRNVTEELQLAGNGFDKKLEYVVGFYYDNAHHYESATQQFFDLSPLAPGAIVSYEFRSQSEVKALYGQGTYDLSSLTGVNGLKFTSGFRYTSERNTLDYSDNPGTPFFTQATESELFKNPSWQVGLNYQVSPALMLYAVNRGSWRSGGFNPFAPSNPTTAEAGGGNKFLPEKTHDVEIGAKFRGKAGDAPVSLEIAAFRQSIQNVQKVSYITVNNNPSAVTTNVPAARVQGVEVTGSIRPTDWLELGFNGAFIDPVFTKSRALILGGGFNDFGPFADVPRQSGTAYAQVTLPTPEKWGPVSVRGDIYGQSVQYFSNLNNSINPGSNLPGYALVNLRLDWKGIMGSAVTISAFAKNVTDKAYYSGGIAYGAAFGTNSARWAEPRTFGGEITVEF
jgi:iron complex outermembrane receptor protein